MFDVYVCFSVFVLSCVKVEALRWADHSSKKSYRLWIDQETENRPGPTAAVEPAQKKKKMYNVLRVF
jgi:hypothetical protein